MKRLSLWAGFAIAVFLTSNSFGAPTSWAPWVAPDRYDTGYLGLIVSDQLNSSEQYSILFGQQASQETLCTSTGGNCADSSSFRYNAVLAPCSSLVVTNCIDFFAANTFSGSAPARFEKIVYPDHRNVYAGDEKIGLPKSSEPSIWSIPSAPHENGNLYALVTGISGSFKPGEKISNPSLYARLLAVHEVKTGASAAQDQNGAFFYPGCWVRNDSGSGKIGCNNLMVMGVGPAKVPCVLMQDTGPTCYIQDRFPSDTSFSISLKLGMKVNGWLHGRISNSQVSISNNSSGGQNVSITAAPVDVPIVAGGDSYTKLPQNLQTAYATDTQIHAAGNGFTRLGGSLYNSDPLIRNWTLSPFPYGEAAMSTLSNWLEYVGNKSVSETPSWEFHTLGDFQNSRLNPCFASASGLIGLVSTNSTTYADGPPALVDQTLNYKVESAHFTSKGQEFQGTYSLNLRSDIARCIYGFSSAPINAAVSVVSSNGQTQIVSTSFSEINGWINFAANGFTFSAPTVKVKLTQDVPAKTPDPISTSAPKPIVKATTISCVKGEGIKKVTALKPTCPKGYVKK